MPLPSYKDIAELIKAGVTIEAQEKIMELRQAALLIEEENIGLKTQVRELQARITELERVDGEPCPGCRKRAWVVQSITNDPVLGVAGGKRHHYKCGECGMTDSVLVLPK